jgi:hypothetical protein
MLAVLMWIVPMTLHAQAQNHTPVDDAADAPKIVFESLEHDFGTAKPNESLTHEFVFSNQGTAALIIEKVKAG